MTNCSSCPVGGRRPVWSRTSALQAENTGSNPVDRIFYYYTKYLEIIFSSNI